MCVLLIEVSMCRGSGRLHIEASFDVHLYYQ